MKKTIILIVSILGIGCSPKTYQTQSFADLNYKDYQSSIDSTFNYAEDIKELFIIEKKDTTVIEVSQGPRGKTNVGAK